MNCLIIVIWGRKISQISMIGRFIGTVPLLCYLSIAYLPLIGLTPNKLITQLTPSGVLL